MRFSHEAGESVPHGRHVAAVIAAPTIALAAPVAPVVHSVGTSAAGGVAATGGFIGFVAVLAGYDLIRRTTS